MNKEQAKVYRAHFAVSLTFLRPQTLRRRGFAINPNEVPPAMIALQKLGASKVRIAMRRIKMPNPASRIPVQNPRPRSSFKSEAESELSTY